MTDHPKFTEALEKLRPNIERLIRDVDNNPAACVTGFIFTLNPKGFIKFGNIANSGDDLIHLHMVLASLAAEATENPTDYADVPFADVHMGDKPLGQAPEEIADALARSVLVTALEPEHTAQALELAQRYMQARRVPNAG